MNFCERNALLPRRLGPEMRTLSLPGRLAAIRFHASAPALWLLADGVKNESQEGGLAAPHPWTPY